MNSLRGMPIAAAVNPKAILPDNANTTTTVVPLAMNLHRRVLTMVRFCESTLITHRSYQPMVNSTSPRASQGFHNPPAQRLRESHPILTMRSGIGIPINLNGRPSKRMAIFERSDCVGNSFHLNEQGEVSGPFHLHRRPQDPNQMTPNLARASSTVPSLSLPRYWLCRDLLSNFR